MIKVKKEQEIEKIKKRIIPILKQYKVTKAGIFGSFARGEQKKNSDVDILIEMDDGSGLIKLIQLKAKLEKEVGKKVDVVEYCAIRRQLRESILRDEIPIEL